ncbi:MAG: hypothetical protein CL878_00455 [Dehalococcoidia bacterium]|nr:hypothetical protein [Dehalococcoidia bacterium]
MAALHLLWWWLVVQALWLVALPICLQVLRPLPDRGTSVAKAFGILVFVYPLWFIGSLGFLDNSLVSYTLVLAAIGAVSVAIWRRSTDELLPFLRSHRGLLIVQEAIFLTAYLGFGLIRMFNPEVANTEKFMDFAFMSGALRSESFPPLDPWFAGDTINYYYFGHLSVAILTRLSGLPLAETFNLTLALLFGLAALGAFGIVFNLVQVHHRTRAQSRSASAGRPGGRRESGRRVRPADHNEVKSRSRLPGAAPAAVAAGLLAIYLLLIGGNLQGPLALLRDSGYLDRDFWQGMGWHSTRVLVIKAGEAALQPLAGQTVSGSVSLTDAGLYRSEATLKLAGLKPNSSYRVLLSRGSCREPGGEGERLTTLRADGGGQAAGVVTLGSSLPELIDGAFHITVQPSDSPVAPLACGDVAGRDLDYTINEFPAFSFLLGDLHPHVLALPFTLLAVQVAFSWWLRPPAPRWSEWRRDRAEVGRLFVGAGMLGALYILNSWDFPAYFALAAVVMTGAMILRTPTIRGVGTALASAAITAVVAVALFFPFYADFRPPASSLGLVPIRSRVDQFFVFWGLMLVPSLAFLVSAFPWRNLGLRWGTFMSGKREAKPAAATGLGLGPGAIWAAAFALAAALAALRGNGVLAMSFLVGLAAAWAIWAQRERRSVVFGLVLIGLAAALIGACEVVYVQDFYGAALRRMNTVFKLYYQAWTLLALAGAFGTNVVVSALWRAVQANRPAARAIVSSAAAVGVALVGLGLFYPVVTTMQRTNSFRNEPTLDGFGFLKRHQPEDHQAAQWLIENVSGRPVVLEAVGGPYSQYARIATQTGLPTVLGWTQHERLWRGEAASNDIAERERDVDTIYRASSLAEVQHLLDRYNVEYIVYSYLEASKYRDYGAAARAKFDASLETVFRAGNTAVYKVGTSGPLKSRAPAQLPRGG